MAPFSMWKSDETEGAEDPSSRVNTIPRCVHPPVTSLTYSLVESFKVYPELASIFFRPVLK